MVGRQIGMPSIVLNELLDQVFQLNFFPFTVDCL